MTSVFIFKRLPTAKGKIIYASRTWTIEKTAITANGYQIELYVIQEIAIGNKEDIIMPT